MYVKSLSLRQFRTYSRLEIDLPAASILLLGANAQGKTSLLEAIAFLSLGASPLTSTDRQVIHWAATESGMPYAHLQAEIVRGGETETLTIALERRTLANGQERLEKRFRIGQRNVRRAEFTGRLNVVLFLPQDLSLVYGPPAERRRYLNGLLAQAHPTYAEVHTIYSQAMARRNALLRHLRDHGGDPRQLIPYEERLVRAGVTISLYRKRLIEAMEPTIDRLHRELTGDEAWLRLEYRPNLDEVHQFENSQGEALSASATDIEALYEAYRQRLLETRPREIARGVTLVGPHRDEVRFISNGRDLGIYGSRGQQRTAVLALHLAELAWLQQITGESPVLLLDEVLAELDHARRSYLLRALQDIEQTILATTDVELVPHSYRDQATIFSVSAGLIQRISPEDDPTGNGA